jgi:alpha-tubulin suppressor-like RCC1 family protein
VTRALALLRLPALVLGAALLGCGDARPTAPASAAPTAELPVLVSVVGTATVGVVARVTAPDIGTPLVFNLAASAGTVAGRITVPVGRDRTIVLEAFAPSGAVTHRGSAGPMTVAEGLNAAVDLRLLPLGDERELGATMGYYLRVTPSSATLRVGERVRLRAIAADPTGAHVEVPAGAGGGSVVQWASTDVRRAVVDTGGAVVALDTGDVEIVAVGHGGAARTRLRVTARDPFRWLSVASGGESSCGVSADSLVYCWGSNDGGQLGIGTKDEAAHPRPLRVPLSGRFVQTAVGYWHACALDRAGSVYCWGSNEYGVLGSELSGDACASAPECLTPVRVVGVPALVSIASGALHTCGVTAAGDAWCWGDNWANQLGDAPEDCFEWECNRPVLAASGFGFVAIRAGDSHTCALDGPGAAWCWGDNSEAELGVDVAIEASGCDAFFENCFLPQRVTGGNVFRALSLGYYQSCGVTTAGRVMCWGANWSGQGGRGTTSPDGDFTPAPVTVAGLESVAARDVSASGWERVCALTVAGEARCWGDGYGLAPTVGVSGDLRLASLSHEGEHGCAVTTTGAAYCWGGRNLFGALGNGAARQSFTPSQVLEPAVP